MEVELLLKVLPVIFLFKWWCGGCSIGDASGGDSGGGGIRWSHDMDISVFWGPWEYLSGKSDLL